MSLPKTEIESTASEHYWARAVAGLTPIDGGYRVKLNKSGTHYIDLMKMTYNWRIVTSPAVQGDTPCWYDRGWCYIAETRSMSFGQALVAALMWDGEDDTEPVGYGKALQ